MISDLPKSQTESKPDAIQRAIEYGVDITLLIENLKRTPTERIDNFLRWMAFAEKVRHAGVKRRGDDARSATTP